MSDFKGLYNIRDMVPNDKNFIMATLLRGIYYGDPYFTAIPKDIFMKNYKVIAETLLDSGKVNVKLACLKEDPDTILGYSILSADYQCIIWIFIKSPWRKRGIGKSLLPQHPQAYMHLTPIGNELLHKFPGIVFNPFYPITSRSL